MEYLKSRWWFDYRAMFFCLKLKCLDNHVPAAETVMNK